MMLRMSKVICSSALPAMECQRDDGYLPINNKSQALSLTTTASHSIQNSSLDNVQSTGVGKTLAVRCVVESVANLQYCDLPYSNHGSGQVEVDRQASVPVHTVFHNLVEAVLQIFGYPKETAVTAKGSILIENWKPIKLEKVAQNPQKTVYDILGQISSFVTLKIQILRTSSCANAILTQMKEKLLQLLMVQNRDHILSSGCPLDQITLKSMLRGVDYGTTVPSDDVIRKFEQWISSQYRQALRPLPYPSPLAQFPFPMGSPSSLHHDKTHIGSSEDRVHPALQTVQSQYPTQKTRMRTSFDAEHELPRLQKWFSENQHPSRQQIMQYVNELNSLESRRGRKPLDVNNVVYWFKNARAAQKRTEGRNVSNAPNNSINGYRSDSHSPCDTAVTSKESLGSVHESCDEDDVGLDDDNRSDGEGEEGDDSLDARPSGSPVAPLSLTTHKANKRSRSSSPVDKIKQEPPDKLASSERLSALARSTPVPDGSKKMKSESPAGQEFDTDEEDVDDDISEPESIHNKNSESESRNSIFSNPSPLSLIPRSMNNSVFPMVPSTMFNHNFSMFTPYIQSIQNMNMNRSVSVSHNSPQPHTNNHSPYSDDKRKRNRTFIDPVTEVPCLEKWFHMNTHPSHGLIMQYTEDLNSMAYRQKFPKLEPKNVQFWFKNRRAKCKRLKSSLYESITSNNNLSPQEHYHLAAALAGENYRMQE